LFIFVFSNTNIMASVREVYTTLQGLANKDERGFVTPAVFNQFAGTAQQKVYNNIWMELERATAARIRGVDPGFSESRLRGLRQDLSQFITREFLNPSTDNTYPRLSSNITLPENFNRIVEVNYYPRPVGLSLDGVDGTGSSNSDYIPLEIIDDSNKLQAILSSTLSRPTKTFPACYIAEGVAEVYPHNLEFNNDSDADNIADRLQLEFVYYKNPEGIVASGTTRSSSLPKFGFTVTNNKEVYNESNSIDFELPDHYVMDLVIEMAKLIGVNLKDREVYQHAAQEDVKEQRQ